MAGPIESFAARRSTLISPDTKAPAEELLRVAMRKQEELLDQKHKIYYQLDEQRREIERLILELRNGRS